MHVAPLTAADAPRYRELMLRAYADDADAFTSTAEERQHEPLSWWVDRIEPASGLGQAWGVFDDGRLVGSVALQYTAKPKTRHVALAIGMFVLPQARRGGAGRALMQAAIAGAAARPGIRVLQLSVTEGNEPARRLYTSLGFATWGVEPMALRTPGGWRGKVYMSMVLPEAAPPA